VGGTLKIPKRGEKESDRKMNKKLVALLIPLLIMPLVAFAYAHWTDSVYKKYKLRFGTVEIEIYSWHVDDIIAWDADSDGRIFGDEVVVTEVKDNDGHIIGLQIWASPIGPGFHLEFKMLVHNYGRLPVRIRTPVWRIGLFKDDPYWDDLTVNQTELLNYISYTTQYFRHNSVYGDSHGCYNATHYDISVGATQWVYEPCESVLIKQTIDFKEEIQYKQSDFQCHWLRIDCMIEAENDDGSHYSSYTGTNSWIEEQPVR
jgi:hypothetical protein